MKLNNIPVLFLKMGAPFLAALLSHMFNLSLTSFVVLRQWRAAPILPMPKSGTPLQHADYRPISITPVLSRVLERIVVRLIYPTTLYVHHHLLDSVFLINMLLQPTGYAAVALIQSLHITEKE